MSILNGYISTHNIILLTDTLHYKRGSNNEIVPINFQSKVFILPHLNVCFCVQAGNLDCGLLFFNYLQKQIVGDEIRTIIQQLRNAIVFGDILSELMLPENNGRILLFGMYYTFDVLETYAITFLNGAVNVELAYEVSEDKATIFSKPEIDTTAYKWDNADDMIASFEEMIKDQKAIEEVLPNENKDGIGGSIQVTYLSLFDRRVSFQIYKLLDFKDKTDMHVVMWKNWKKE